MYRGISIFALPVPAPSVKEAMAKLESANEILGRLDGYLAIYGFQGEADVLDTTPLGDFRPWASWLEKITDDLLIAVMFHTSGLASARIRLSKIQQGRVVTNRARKNGVLTRVPVTEESVLQSIDDNEAKIKVWLDRFNAFLAALGHTETLDAALAADKERVYQRALASDARSRAKDDAGVGVKVRRTHK